ncbi:MAG: manganese transporter [Bacteroidetes bacterium RIFOXYA12_FULL_40_10]|nr:MAG: manganese transporter [Bacteroidetes bacterium RIFOXYA12_FULL_40_10]
MKKPIRFKFGPGALVTAAFIGPGTITTCSIAGAKFGYALLWGLVFSIIATVVLQEMSARLGIITRQGLGEALRKHFTSPLVRVVSAVLVISAIGIGNAAFETGNLLGASLGIGSLVPTANLRVGTWSVIIGALASILLFAGSYKLIERVLIGLVIMMSLAFLTTAFIISPVLADILRGMFVPTLPAGSLLALVGLIGTTVVPYNLFLHASAVQQRWNKPEDIPEARLDISVSVILGGLISIAIVVTSAVAFFGTGIAISSGSDLALQLEPVMGGWSKYFIGVGLFAAGISSAITAPLAAAYAISGILGWKRDLKSLRFRLVWMAILLVGVIFSVIGFKPLEAILFAQAANGVLLPVIAIYLLWVMNSKRVMGSNTNGSLSNIIGVVVVLVALGIGLRTLFHVFGVF